MTKFVDAIRRKLSSEVTFVERQKLMKSFQTPVSGFPNKRKAAFSWPNELKQFHSIWQTYLLCGTGSKTPIREWFLRDTINKFGAFHIKSGDKSFDDKVVVGSMTNIRLGRFDPCGKAELISWGSLPQMENLWDSLTLIAESREHTSAWYHSPYKSSDILTQCLRLSHLSKLCKKTFLSSCRCYSFPFKTHQIYLKIGTCWLIVIIQQIYVLRYYNSASGWLAMLGETDLLEILFLAKFSQLSKKLWNSLPSVCWAMEFWILDLCLLKVKMCILLELKIK